MKNICVILLLFGITMAANAQDTVKRAPVRRYTIVVHHWMKKTIDENLK